MWKGNGLLWNKIQEGEGNMMSDNINKFDRMKYSNFLILIRIVNKGFVLLNFKDLEKIMQSWRNEENNLLKVWGFNIEIKENFVKIINRKDKSILESSTINRENIKIKFI